VEFFPNAMTLAPNEKKAITARFSSGESCAFEEVYELKVKDSPSQYI